MSEFINNFLEAFSPLVPLIFLLIYFNQVKRSKEFILLFVVYFLFFLLNSVATIYAYYDTENIWVYDLVGLTSFISISFYMALLMKTGKYKKIIYFILPVFSSFYLGYTYILGNSSIFNSIGYALLAVIISIFCILYFMECISLADERKLSEIYSFWVVTSFFVYYLGSFFIFITYKAMTANGINTGLLWGLHNIIYFISCCIAAFGIWKHFQKNFISLPA